jgi:2-oxoglutarate ferredoxin oxidoreductase subunit gamma
MNKEIRICGFGGQGIILTGMIIGKAAALYDNKFSSLIQAFGPEARGSSCSAQVIISDTKILYPYITSSDVMVAMSQEAYKRFVPELKVGGIILYDDELVTPDNNVDARAYGIPVTRIAERDLKKKMVMNIIMIGFFAAKAGIISVEAARKAVLDSVPKGTEDVNTKAFELGLKERF